MTETKAEQLDSRDSGGDPGKPTEARLPYVYLSAAHVPFASLPRVLVRQNELQRLSGLL